MAVGRGGGPAGLPVVRDHRGPLRRLPRRLGRGAGHLGQAGDGAVRPRDERHLVPVGRVGQRQRAR
ncbi:hypothetical protein [Ornithinimicrobium kibberense]|uniref:hypothetical protein n=1 Tax=Ornithinimicrobium kibberense TaxID=282060 RepID=UPI003609DB5D